MAEKSQTVQWVWICKHGIPGKMASTQILHACMHAAVMYFLSLLAWCISEVTQKSSHAWSVLQLNTPFSFHVCGRSHHTFPWLRYLALIRRFWMFWGKWKGMQAITMNQTQDISGLCSQCSATDLRQLDRTSKLVVYCGDVATIIPLICAVFIFRWWCSTKWSKWVFHWLWL